MNTKSQQNTGKRHQVAAERSKTDPNSSRTQQNDTKSLQNTAKRPHIVAKRSKNDPNSLQNAAKRHQIQELILYIMNQIA